MGQILHIGGGEISDAPRKRHTAKGKRALVLGGGGIAGASFEIGALLALDDALTDFTANDFDVYVGTSAGAFLCSFLANGISPEDFARSQISKPPPGVPSIRPQEILKPVPGRVWRGASAWVGGVRGTARHVVKNRTHTSLVDLFFSLAEELKSSMYTTSGMEAYLKRLFSVEGRTNEFGETAKELYVTATDLDTAERIVFGFEGMPEASISQAVAASAAIPVIYDPVKIDGREYLDGGLRSPTNLDIAIASGADFIVLINPLVPYLHDPRYLLRSLDQEVRHISEGGLGRLVAQVFRVMARSQLEKELDLLRSAHPEVDVIVIEPPRDDEHLFAFNLMDYEAREEIAKTAFEQIAVDLVTHFPEVKKIFGAHGISVSKKVLVAQLQHVLSGGTAHALIERHGEETA